MEENKNLSVIQPLIKFPYNFVYYNISGVFKVFCEEVSTYNGYVIMTNIRIETKVYATIEPIESIYSYYGSTKRERLNNFNFNEAAYSFVDCRIIPEKAVQTINSYKDGSELALWVKTTKEAALKKANERVKEHNDKTRKKNCEVFSEIINESIERFLDIKYSNFSRIKRMLNKKPEWKEKQRALPEFRKVIEDIIEEVKKDYEGIEYEGTLQYKPDEA